jgi:pyridoxine/pyridoxamine 5'-phosphate oxidase
MDVSSVSKPPVNPSAASKNTVKTDLIDQLRKSIAQNKAAQQHKEPEAKPLPVVNTQGHTTGRVLNVKA